MEAKFNKSDLALVTLFSLTFVFSCGQISLRKDPVTLGTTLLNSASTSSNSIETNCSGTIGLDSTYGCMPITNISGKLYSASLLVGQSTGTPYYLGPIFGVTSNPTLVKSLRAYRLLEFNVTHAPRMLGSFECCGDSNVEFPQSEQLSILGIAFYVGYLDLHFSWTSSDSVPQSLLGNHTIRVVFSNMGDLGYKKGDILYKLQSATELKWCTEASDCTHTSRPDLPIQWSEIVGFSNEEESYNKVIPQFFVKATSPVVINSNELQNRSKSWELSATLNNSQALYFTSNPMAFTKMAEVVNALRLVTRPGNWSYPYPAAFEIAQTYPGAEPSVSPSVSPSISE